MSKSSFIKLFFVLVLAVVGVGSIGWKILVSDDSMTIDEGIMVDPGTMGGKKLTGTDDVRLNFSVSPDGKWLLYDSLDGSAFNPIYVLYNTKEQKRHEIKLSHRALEIADSGLGTLGAGCWNADSTQVFLSTALVNPYTLFMLDVRTKELQMEVLEDAGKSKWQYYDECSTLSEPSSLVRAVQHSPREIHIVDAGNPQKILARHKAGILMHNFEITETLSYSPDGTRVAYIVGGARFFGTPPRGYVLDLKSAGAGHPKLLGAPTYEPILWGPDSNTVYASVGDGDDISIYVWKLNVEC
jgi:hypothetical protein